MKPPCLVSHLAVWCLVYVAGCTATDDAPVVPHDKLRVLIIDGNNPYHEWQKTTPLLKRLLEESGRFVVDVATLPIAEQPPEVAVRGVTSGTPGAKSADPQTGNFRP